MAPNTLQITTKKKFHNLNNINSSNLIFQLKKQSFGNIMLFQIHDFRISTYVRGKVTHGVSGAHFLLIIGFFFLQFNLVSSKSDIFALRFPFNYMFAALMSPCTTLSGDPSYRKAKPFCNVHTIFLPFKLVIFQLVFLWAHN